MTRDKIKKLVRELREAKLLTSATGSNKAYDNFEDEGEDLKFILTSGEPYGKSECSRCMKILPDDQFTYYQARVSKNGYLQRVNAVCHECSGKGDAELKNAILNSGDIPSKPEPGSTCPNCDRKWYKNWHRHHRGDKFIAWWCGQCNMSQQDHRLDVTKNK